MNLAKEVGQFGTVADNLTTDEDLGFQDAGRMDFRLRRRLGGFPKAAEVPEESRSRRSGSIVDEYRKSLPARQAAE